jgi:penicillin-insensitive murein endopeptidase
VRRLVAGLIASAAFAFGMTAFADDPSGAPPSAPTAPAAAPPTHSSATPSDSSARPRHRRRGERPHPPSLSMGYANGGRLQNAARLDEDETVRYMPGRVLHYGTDELIGLLRRTARTVFHRYHARMTVGDLSASRGGPVGHHASHQSGRDADVSFFVVDRRGQPVMLSDFVAFGRDGSAMAGGTLHFDTARNWALAEALLEDPLVHVEHIFVSNPLRALLLDYARTHGASPSLVTHAENTMHQPVHASPHANHFHVRIACPHEDGACVEGVRIIARHRRRGRLASHESRRHRGHDAVAAHEPHAAPTDSHASEPSTSATPALSTDPSADSTGADENVSE